MKTTNKTLKNFTSVTGWHPVYEIEEYTKKELSYKDCCFLKYILTRFIYENKSNIYQFMDMEPEREERLYYEIDNSSNIAMNALFMGNFEGYDIAEDAKIMSIELTTENRVILNVYDKKDSYKQYLIC
jgi:hypothetical protein